MLGKVNDTNIILHEFIGLHATITNSPDVTLKNRSGIIIDETMNTFTLEYYHGKQPISIIVPKHTNTFKFEIPRSRNQSLTEPYMVEVNGSDITKRPEDRIKRLAKLANQMQKKQKQKQKQKTRD